MSYFSLLVFPYDNGLMAFYKECIKNVLELRKRYDFTIPQLIERQKYNDFMEILPPNHFFIGRLDNNDREHVFFLKTNDGKSYFLRQWMDNFRELTPGSFVNTLFVIFGYRNAYSQLTFAKIKKSVFDGFGFGDGGFAGRGFGFHKPNTQGRRQQAIPMQVQTRRQEPVPMQVQTRRQEPVPMQLQAKQTNTMPRQQNLTQQEQQQLLKMQYQQLKQKQFFSTDQLDSDNDMTELFLQFYYSPYIQNFQPNYHCSTENLNCFIKYDPDNKTKILERFALDYIPESIKREIKRQFKFADTLSFLELLLLFTYSINSFAHITSYLSRKFNKDNFYNWFRHKPGNLHLNVLLVPFMYFIFVKRVSSDWVKTNRMNRFSKFSFQEFDFNTYFIEMRRYRRDKQKVYHVFIRLTQDLNNFLDAKCLDQKFNAYELNTLLEIMAELIDHVFLKAPYLRTELQLYRGVKEKKFVQQGSTVNHGIVHFYNTNFSSTAISKSHSEGYIQNDGALLIVNCPIGTKIIFLESFTFYNHEYEFVLPRDTVFHITNEIVKNEGIRYTEIYMTMLQKEKRPDFVGGQYSVYNYKIGIPISKDKARRFFVNKTIKRHLIHGFQRDAIHKTTFDDPLSGEHNIPLTNCVQLKDGTIFTKDYFEETLNMFTTMWQGRESVGFKNPYLNYIYGNIVCTPAQDGYQPQKPGILMITLIHTEPYLSNVGSEKIYRLEYLTIHRIPYLVKEDRQPLRCYLPHNEVGNTLLLFYIEAFKKGNLFRFSATDPNVLRYGGPIHLLTKRFYNTNRLTPDKFLDKQQEFWQIGIMNETLKNKHFDGAHPDPYPREKRFLIEFQVA